MNKTTNYNLNQWEAGDRVLRSDFNADNAKLDAAIKAVDRRVDGLAASKADVSALAAYGNCQVEYGTYVGTGTHGENNPTTLRLGYQPKLVFIGREYYHSMFIWGCHGHSGGGSLQTRWLADGLEWWVGGGVDPAASQLNTKGAVYHYIAFH